MSGAVRNLGHEWLKAAYNGSVEDLKLLLAEHPELIHFRATFESLKSCTALHLCAWRNQPAAAAFLIANGADIEARDEAGLTPLQVDIMRVCMINMRPTPIVRSECRDLTCSADVRLALFKRKLVRDRSSYSQIDMSTFELLLAAQANVNTPCDVGESVLHLAVEDGLVRHVQLLLEYHADPFFSDKDGRLMLEIAAEHGYEDLVQLFMNSYPEMIKLGGPEAIRAAVCHDANAVVELLWSPVLQTLPDDEKRTQLGGELLHVAIDYNSPRCVDFLLDHDVPVDYRDSKGETALHVASRRNLPELVQSLLERHADATLCVLSNGFSVYHLVVQYYALQAIQVLAVWGVDINLLDRNQDSPLAFAVKNRYAIELLETLLRHGAHFRFQSRRSRDDVAPVLVSWIVHLASDQLPALIDRLIVSGCVQHERARRLITSLLWAGHTSEALLLVFLALFSTTSQAAQHGLVIIYEWLTPYHTNLVVPKLLHDVLRR
ncbi:hypothetical protein Poli38472_010742 [Pythium oligandrum]|uniref:Ankyrin repeat protein n=1 Tax=Pythium oligandrum TaxID=41045 RepID=A0A8K1FI40_PYTOL|nr:hypothetical protein Poli38472_010742 [Pythium oligandrum]|eukprot:TMW61679.1 hypothetical protein Poli38472_010742 [Pythium oligandrum]